MQLQDATDKASVDLFIRSLDFDFQRALVVGLPGDILGLEVPTSGHSLPVLIHELEHVRTLMYPLDGLFISLGLRMADLRLVAVERFNHWTDKIRSSNFDVLREEAYQALFDTERAARFSRNVLYTAELMLPLLEGLALLAELEIGSAEASRSWDMAIAIQYEHFRRVKLMENPKNRSIFDGATEEAKSNVREILARTLEKRLEVSRQDRRLMFRRRLFFREKFDSNPRASTPYFLGYLFIRRLYEAWSKRVPDLAFGRFYHIATRAFCEVVPMSLLRLYTLDPKRFVTDNFTAVFSWTLEMLLSLLQGDIERIEIAEEPLAMRPDASDRGEVYVLSPAGVHFDEIAVMKFIQWSVFDSSDLNTADEAAKTEELLRLERSKFLTPVATLMIRIVAVDEELRAAIIVDPTVVGNEEHGGPVEKRGVTFFAFSSDDDFSLFLSTYESHDQKIPRIERHADRIVIPGDTPLPGFLRTYLFFYPSGLPRVGDNTPRSAVVMIQTLLVDDEKSRRLFISAGGVEDHVDIVNGLADRERAGVLRKHIQAALQPSFDEFRYAIEQIDTLYSDYRKESGSALRAIPKGWFAQTQTECAAVYTSTLFPRCDALETIRTEKFSFLQAYLSRPDFLLLQRCLLKGAVLHPERRYEVSSASEKSVSDAVNRIRAVCIEKLGIPLIRLQLGPLAVVLDLLPVDMRSPGHLV
jgi:hypothetical protein